MKVCTISGCSRRHNARGYCHNHYQRWSQTGNPLGIPKVRRLAVIDGDTAKIPLGPDGRDGFTVVDAADKGVDEYLWHLDGDGYAKNSVLGRLQNYLMGKPARGFVNDHINRDRLDNRRSNLRLITKWRNSQNRSVGANSVSQTLGVMWHKRHNKWIANIRVRGQLIHIGYFDNMQDAIKARKYVEGRVYEA